MKLTTAGQAGSRNNRPALTYFRDVGEEGILHFARWRYRRWFIGSPRGALIAGPDAALSLSHSVEPNAIDLKVLIPLTYA